MRSPITGSMSKKSSRIAGPRQRVGFVVGFVMAAVMVAATSVWLARHFQSGAQSGADTSADPTEEARSENERHPAGTPGVATPASISSPASHIVRGSGALPAAGIAKFEPPQASIPLEALRTSPDPSLRIQALALLSTSQESAAKKAQLALEVLEAPALASEDPRRSALPPLREFALMLYIANEKDKAQARQTLQKLVQQKSDDTFSAQAKRALARLESIRQ